MGCYELLTRRPVLPKRAYSMEIVSLLLLMMMIVEKSVLIVCCKLKGDPTYVALYNNP